MVSPEYFETMGLRLLGGRGFAATDVDGQPGGGHHQRAPGRRSSGTSIRSASRINLGDWVTVVGIVSDARRESLDVAAEAEPSTCRTSSSRCRS